MLQSLEGRHARTEQIEDDDHASSHEGRHAWTEQIEDDDHDSSTTVYRGPSLDVPKELDALYQLVFKEKGQGISKQLVELVHNIIGTDIWATALSHISEISERGFKKTTYDGAVWMQRQWRDLGNYCYTVLWQLSWYCCKDLPSSHVDTYAFMNRLVQKYPSLADHWPRSPHSQELKGDVIEYALALTYLTGPAVNEVVRNQRLQFQSLMRQWFEAFVKVIKQVANHYGIGYPPQRLLPKERPLAQLIGLANAASRPDAPSKDFLIRRFAHHALRR